MQTRHRIPTIFNLSMVDVLCCALGCVILLWLVYFKEARERALATGQSSTQLKVAKLKLETVTRDLTFSQQGLLAAQHRNEYLSGQLAEILTQRDQLLAGSEQTDKDHQATISALKDAKDSLAAFQKEIRGLEKTVGDQKAALAAASSGGNDLKSKLAAAEKRAAKLEQEALTLNTLSKEYREQLNKIETKAAKLEGDLDKRKLDFADGNKRYEELMAAKNLLEKSLASAKSDLAKSDQSLTAAKLTNSGLVGETKALSQQINKLRAAAENRFAGIELKGTRVLFLVDMSGSMRMKDNDAEDPEKWPLVCEILGKLMQSLPDLKQFQILLFSDKVRYPLGNDGKWQDYRGPGSVKAAVAAVRAMTPRNETNMSAAFEEAFRFRASGLDTIYLMSDGLPNAGDGMPASAARLTEAQRGTALGKYIRDRLKTKWNMPQGSVGKQRVRINAVGFYFDSPDVGAFLWALARDNDGSFVGLSKP